MVRGVAWCKTKLMEPKPTKQNTWCCADDPEQRERSRKARPIYTPAETSPLLPGVVT